MKVKPVRIGKPDASGYVTVTMHKDNLPALRIMAQRAWYDAHTGQHEDMERRMHALAYHMMHELK